MSDDQTAMTRRGLFGAVAGALAVIASALRRRRGDDEAAPKARRRGFWIGHN